MTRTFLNTCLAVIAASFIFPAGAIADELNIYSYRQPKLLKPFLDAYSAETGVKFNIVHAPKGLAQRLQAEGASSPADIVLTTDVSRLVELADLDLLAPYQSGIIEGNVPSYLRNTAGTWTALSTRARVIVVSKSRVAEGAVGSILDLANPEWQGRLCTRKGSHVYNRALLASLIVRFGEDAAEQWAADYVGNLARRPQGNDRAQAKAIFAGECDIALMNTYYFGKMKFNEKNPEQREWADSLRIVFTDQDSHGQHVNISGGAIVKTAPHPDAARAFLEWMTEETAQHIYARINFEYPVNPDVKPDAEVASWGQFIADDLPLDDIAKAAPRAQMIIDRVNW
ncbi:MAG: extracellular solute-binding protein [Alphaproteobacteria bacterium]|nr:extracellular solute-binding protein [Alphaproteobacteria bacterium]